MSFRPILALVFLLALSSCATFYTPRKPLPISEAVTLAKSGAPPQVVIQRIRDSGTTYALRGSDFAKLKADGVPDPVLDFLQQSLVDDVDQLTKYWVLGESLGACAFCYPQPVDMDKLESGYGVVAATAPGYYQAGKPPGVPDWVPSTVVSPAAGRISVSDLVQMVKDGVPEAQIVERINHSHLTRVIGVGGTFTVRSHPATGLSGSEFAWLHEQGAGYPVLDALQSQFLAQFIEAERMRYQNLGKGPGAMI
jgi:hypothetical protein